MYVQWNIICSRERRISYHLPPAWMPIEGMTLCELSQTEKDKYCMISSICGILKTKLMITETRMVVTRGWGGWELEDVVGEHNLATSR